MNEKDKIILSDSSTAIIDGALNMADQIVSAIPFLNIAWALSKSLYGAGLKLRQKRALEWVEMVRDNPHIFVEQILVDESFQDGFVYMLENYIRERSDKKRKIAKNIFLGFIKADDKNSFSMEKFVHTLNQLSEKDIEVIPKLDAWLKERGYSALITRQPGGTATGDRIRELLLDSRSAGLASLAEMALMFADRAQCIAEVIEPALAAGRIVLCDRFTDSTEAYQGGGRELGSEVVLEMHRLVCGNLHPDLTLLLLPSLEASLERARRRNERCD